MGGSKHLLGGRTALVLSLLGLAAAWLGLLAPAASAFQLTTHSLSSSFDGTGSTAGPFEGDLASVAVDEKTGSVYAIAFQHEKLALDKFNAAGVATAFSSLLGSTSITWSVSGFGVRRLAVDNSSTATQGRIYVLGTNEGRVWAYEPSGEPALGYPVGAPSQTADVAVDPRNGDLWFVSEFQDKAIQYTPNGREATGVSVSTAYNPEEVDVDSAGNLYIREYGNQEEKGIYKYNPSGEFEYRLPAAAGDRTIDSLALDPSGDAYLAEESGVSEFSPTGNLVAKFGSALKGVHGVAVDGASGDVYAGMGSPGNGVDIFAPGATVTVPDVQTGAASEFAATAVTLHGTVDPNGINTTKCRFQWSADSSFASSIPCKEGEVLTGSGAQEVSAELSGLTQGQRYHYRLIAENENGEVIGRQDQTFTPSAAPHLGAQWATDVHSDSFTAHTEINPEGAATTYLVQYGPEDCASSGCQESKSLDVGGGLESVPQSLEVTGLSPGSTYHYRVVASNQAGTTYGPDETITTFPYTAVLNDPCPNAHVRQQTGAALLPDCRAYELVSASNTGGYNVASDLNEGQEPYGGYPEAENRVLYGIHSGAIPGPWDPTNRGTDPYLATRTSEGWRTEYAGLPANAPSGRPFASELAEASPTLSDLAFGGPGICSPCFADGSTGNPLRTESGLAQGMAGSIPQPGATEAGIVQKRFSADGNHFIFGSTSQFEPSANSNGTDATLYERDLGSDSTQVVSTLPSGATIANGGGVAALDVSKDGSRVVVGELISTDAESNPYYHLYLHQGEDSHSVDLTPGTTSGVLFDGMSEDGSRIFFTTTDKLLGEDQDESADIYEARVTGSSSTLRLISTKGDGSASNDDSCEPAGNPHSWNSPEAEGKCGALAFAGGAGVAADGTFYFLSPELLDSTAQAEGEADQANLYEVAPDGHPRFVGLIDTSAGKPAPGLGSHPLANASLISGFSHVQRLGVDQSNGDIYAIDWKSAKEASLKRYTASGAAANFSEPGGSNEILLPGRTGATGRNQVAINNAKNSPFEGDIYVKNSASEVNVYSPSGALLGSIEGPFSEVCGVAVDQSNGDLYVGDRTNFGIWRLKPISTTTPISISDYEVTGIESAEGQEPEVIPCNIAVDSLGNVYAEQAPEGPVRSFKRSDFTDSFPPADGTLIAESVTALTVDPATNNLYLVDEGSRVEVFNPAGELLQTFGEGEIGEFAQGIAVNATTHHVYVSTGEGVVDFGYVLPPYQPISNPAILHATSQAATHTYGDFQTTPTGRYAAFATAVPQSSYDNDGHYEVYRYDAGTGELACASCNPTNARAQGDASLAANGLSLLEDGTLFFNSSDALAPRDLDERQDVYEWEEGSAPQLISTGSSPFASSLLGASANGTDVFFFTRDRLVPQDENGELVKLYDARAEGGFPYLPTPVPCKASDECHGAGSAAPGSLPINTISGRSGNEPPAAKPKRCPKGKVRRKGRCVNKHHHHHRKHRAKRGHGAKRMHGGAK